MSTILALHDGRAGNARQALALACALDADAGERLLVPGLPARWLAPRTWPLLSRPFGDGLRADRAAPPDVAIGCGRQAALATRLLRGPRCKAVQILDPRIDTRHWDLVIAPEHDGLRGDNVIAVRGSLHPVDDLWLARARHEFLDFAALPSPRTLLLVGGPSRHAPLDDARFEATLLTLARHARDDGGSLSMTASRRTPTRWRDAIARLPATLPGVRWRDERDGRNPYAGLLAHAERIVCTPDSVNMLSEAAATLASVFVLAPDALGGRPRKFLDALLACGRVRELDAAMTPFLSTPLRETARVAEAVRQRLHLAS